MGHDDRPGVMLAWPYGLNKGGVDYEVHVIRHSCLASRNLDRSLSLRSRDSTVRSRGPEVARLCLWGALRCPSAHVATEGGGVGGATFGRGEYHGQFTDCRRPKRNEYRHQPEQPY